MRRSSLLLSLTSLGLLGASACFTGEAALDLPCETVTDCGKDQICLKGFCSVPGSEPCGNGLVNTDEECDLGTKNSDDGACTLACKLAVCGDGLVGPDEACDDGAANAPGASCTELCTVHACGDGFQGPGEECDDGEDNGPGQPCTAECKVSACGDGIQGPGEECDDGAANAADAECTPECTVNVCGDGYVGPGERCDSEDRGVCTEDCRLIAFSDDMNGSDNGWTHEVVSEPPPNMLCSTFCFKDQWLRAADLETEGHPDQGGMNRAWYSGNLSEVQGGASSRLISPSIDLRGVEAPVSLNFLHLYSFKELDDVQHYADGGIVEVSADGGPWVQLELDAYITEINNELSSCDPDKSNPLLDLKAFVGELSTWGSVVGALDAYAGSEIRLGFQIGSDCASYATQPYLGGDVEWYIDNVSVVGELP